MLVFFCGFWTTVSFYWIYWLTILSLMPIGSAYYKKYRFLLLQSFSYKATTLIFCGYITTFIWIYLNLLWQSFLLLFDLRLFSLHWFVLQGDIRVMKSQFFRGIISVVFDCSQTKFVAIILVLLAFFWRFFTWSTNFSSDQFDFLSSKKGQNRERPENFKSISAHYSPSMRFTGIILETYTLCVKGDS